MRKLAGWAMLAGSLMAAPRMVTIQDTLYKADGTKFNGVILIDWRSFQTSDNSSVPTQSLVVQVTNGVLRVVLTPSTTAQGEAHYDVRYNSDGRLLFSERWNVPPSTTILTLRDVRSTGGVLTPSGVSTILIGDVIGLEDELAVRPVKGTTFANGRVVVSSSSGTIGSVYGSLSDCVRVDGTSVPCGTGSGTGSGTTFTDGEVPAGAINSANTTFTLAASPDPAASLALYRNGIIQKQGLDYSLSGTAIAFVSAATPQTGDVLIASYRGISAIGGGLPGNSSGSSSPLVSGDGPQIICSNAGASTSSATPVKLGSCMIPAQLIQAGDRFEIRFDYTHAGAASSFGVEAKWGATSLVNRTATAADIAVAGWAGYSVSGSGGVWSTQSWGSGLQFASSAGTTQESASNGIEVGIYGHMSAITADSISLNNVSVVRYPLKSNP